VAPHDRSVFLAVAALLFVVGCVAALGPAARALKVEPRVALHEE
jgi:hypothetical protein